MTVVSARFDDLGADGAQARLGIMGGTFDPIHIGHLRIAEEVREALSLDAVLFVPTGNPVFKRGQHVTDAQVRLAQVRRAVADNPYFDASAIEVERPGDTFTVDTMRAMRSHYPDNVEFYFIVGSDAAATIGKWRGCSELAKLVHLAVAYGRPGFADKDNLRASIRAGAAFDVRMVKVSSLEVSSSDIRQRIADGRSVRYLVAPALEAEAGELGGKDGTADVVAPSQDDPFSDEFFEARKAELACRVGPKRFEHCLGVSSACELLARTYGLDVRKARLAGILHDWDKGMDDDEARARVRELHMEGQVDPWVVENMPRVLHGYTAARALARDFPAIPSDVLQAIDRHTTAATDMAPLDMVLYIADAIEPSRQFGRIDELRAAVGAVSLEELYYQTYEYWTFLLFDRRQPLHPDTMRIWNANVMRWRAIVPKAHRKPGERKERAEENVLDKAEKGKSEGRKGKKKHGKKHGKRHGKKRPKKQKEKRG